MCGRGLGSTRRLGGYVTFHNEPDASGRAGRWYRENYQPPYDEWVVGHGHNSTDQFVADVNADNRGPDAIAYYHSTGCWHAALTNFQSDRLSPPTQWLCGHGIDSTRRLMGDVTGEGRADAVVFRDAVDGQPAGRWDVATSQTNRFASPTQWKNDAAAAGSTDQFLADVNGDRKDDAVVFFADDGCWNVALATPTGSYVNTLTFATHFGNWRQWICDYGIGSTTRMLGEVTGDSRADAIAVYTYPTSWEYGGSNHKVDTEAEKEAVRQALINAGDDGYSQIFAGLTPQDQETMANYIEARDPDYGNPDAPDDDVEATASGHTWKCRWQGETIGPSGKKRPIPPYRTGADALRVNARTEIICDSPEIPKAVNLKTCLEKMTPYNDGRIAWAKIACDDETFHSVEAVTGVTVAAGRDCEDNKSWRYYRTYGHLTMYNVGGDTLTPIKKGSRRSRPVWVRCRAGAA
jgi:hypothetical protein